MVKDLKARLTLGSCLVAALVGLFILDQTYAGVAMILFVTMTLLAQVELYLLIKTRKNILFGIFSGALFLALTWWAPSHRFDGLIVCVVVYLIYEVLTRKVNNATERLSFTFLPILLLPVLLSYGLLIRQIEGVGWDWLLMLIVGCKVGDSFAYFAGSTFGRHKLIPEVSPNKSWEGAIASLVGTLLATFWVASWALADSFGVSLSYVEWFGAAVIINLSAQFSDLVESLLKRGCGSKDSSSLLPAFGGAFDMVDSFLLSAPCLYFYLKIIGVY